MRTRATIIIALALAGCAGADYRPIIDPRSSVSEGRNYESDLAECQTLARQRDPANQAVAEAVFGAVLGAAFGALTGSFYGQADFGAATGGAIGAAGGVVSGASGGMQWQVNAIIGCLRGRGYNVLG